MLSLGYPSYFTIPTPDILSICSAVDHVLITTPSALHLFRASLPPMRAGTFSAASPLACATLSPSGVLYMLSAGGELSTQCFPFSPLCPRVVLRLPATAGQPTCATCSEHFLYVGTSAAHVLRYSLGRTPALREDLALAALPLPQAAREFHGAAVVAVAAAAARLLTRLADGRVVQLPLNGSHADFVYAEVERDGEDEDGDGDEEDEDEDEDEDEEDGEEQEKEEQKEKRAPLRTTAIAALGDDVALATRSGVLHLSAPSMRRVARLPFAGVSSLSWAPGGAALALCSARAGAFVVPRHARTAQPLGAAAGPPAWLPRAGGVLLAGARAGARIRYAGPGVLLRCVELHALAPGAPVLLSPASALLPLTPAPPESDSSPSCPISASSGGAARVLRRLLPPSSLPRPLTLASCSASGRVLAVCGATGVAVAHLEPRGVRWAVDARTPPVRAACFDGGSLVLAFDSRAVRWGAEKTEKTEKTGKTGKPEFAAECGEWALPEPPMLIAASGATLLAASGGRLLLLRGSSTLFDLRPTAPPVSVALSPPFAAVCDALGELRLYPLPSTSFPSSSTSSSSFSSLRSSLSPPMAPVRLAGGICRVWAAAGALLAHGAPGVLLWRLRGALRARGVVRRASALEFDADVLPCGVGGDGAVVGIARAETAPWRPRVVAHPFLQALLAEDDEEKDADVEEKNGDEGEGADPDSRGRLPLPPRLLLSPLLPAALERLCFESPSRGLRALSRLPWLRASTLIAVARKTDVELWPRLFSPMGASALAREALSAGLWGVAAAALRCTLQLEGAEKAAEIGAELLLDRHAADAPDAAAVLRFVAALEPPWPSVSSSSSSSKEIDNKESPEGGLALWPEDLAAEVMGALAARERWREFWEVADAGGARARRGRLRRALRHVPADAVLGRLDRCIRGMHVQFAVDMTPWDAEKPRALRPEAERALLEMFREFVAAERGELVAAVAVVMGDKELLQRQLKQQQALLGPLLRALLKLPAYEQLQKELVRDTSSTPRK